MAKIGLIFPGQGSQSVGMGRTLIDQVPAARAIYDQADSILGFPLSQRILEGPENELKKTDIAQPAILTASIAAWVAFREKTGFALENCLCAGHSLGEYSALVAAGALLFADAISLVRKRGQLMQAAAESCQGSMAAVIGLTEAEVLALCRQADPDGEVEMANLNCPGQIVISGSLPGLEKFSQLAREKKIRVIPLSVSGPFHSHFMQSAADQLLPELQRAPFKLADIPVVANVSVQFLKEPDQVRDALHRQVTGSVRWEESIRAMIQQGVRGMVEIGPGRVLQGLVKKIDPSVPVWGAFSPEEIDAAAAAIAAL